MSESQPDHNFDLSDDRQWEQWCEWELQCGRERVMDEEARLYSMGIIDQGGRLATDRRPSETHPPVSASEEAL
ncbi:MAG: hypothetical protein JXO72_13835 [Vicinamibacteria bacterium]|nr:hypothetical protein [Vicinamibacteria bacterium]